MYMHTVLVEGKWRAQDVDVWEQIRCKHTMCAGGISQLYTSGNSATACVQVLTADGTGRQAQTDGVGAFRDSQHHAYHIDSRWTVWPARFLSLVYRR